MDEYGHHQLRTSKIGGWCVILNPDVDAVAVGVSVNLWTM